MATYNIYRRRLILSSAIPLLSVVLLWIISIFDFLLDLQLYRLGIEPRTLSGLAGIILAPLIHSDWGHLMANTTAFFILGWCLFYFYRRIAPLVMLLLWLGCGTLIWLIGRNSAHIGASGLIFGMAFFIFFSGIIRKEKHRAAAALIVAFLYGSMFWSMLPLAELINPSISWEGHLAGAISGIFCALILQKKDREPQPHSSISDQDEDIILEDPFVI